MKLNIGCGTDYRKGFINVDGSNTLPRVDRIIDLEKESLRNHFNAGEVDFILANDIIEHHFHWQAIRILEDFYFILKQGGQVEIRVPDAEFIIKSWRLPLRTKLNLLFGGQDIPQGFDPEMDRSRRDFPEFFCHKYGWTQQQMKDDLSNIGFSSVRCRRVGTNFITYAIK